MDAIKSELHKIFIKVLQLSIDSEERAELQLVAALGIESISAMEILGRVGQTFQIEIDDDNVSLALVDSLNTLSTYIAR